MSETGENPIKTNRAAPSSSKPLSRFNDAGVLRFRAFLAELRANPTLIPPTEMLEDSAISELIPGTIPVARPAGGLSNKREAAELLRDLLSPLRAAGRDVSQDVGLWTWLTLMFFDDVCPPAPSG